MAATKISFLSSTKGRIIIVILSVIFSSMVFRGWQYMSQQKLDKQADEILSQVDAKSNKLLDAKNTDSKVELSLVQEVFTELDRAETLLNGVKGNSPDKVASIQLFRKARDAAKMIEKGLLNNDNSLKEKGYALFESTMFSEEK